jgi:hypothetical protein
VGETFDRLGGKRPGAGGGSRRGGVAWIRRQPKRRIAAAVVAVFVLAGTGIYALIHTDQGTGQQAGPPTASATASATVTDAGGTSASGPPADPAPQPYIDAKIAWTNDADQSTDPKDPDAVLQVYPSYKIGYAGGPSAKYYRTAPIRVKCQVTNGHPHTVGPYYDGPRPIRNRIWYLMDTNSWVLGMYVDTGKKSLPACSPADADTDS